MRGKIRAFEVIGNIAILQLPNEAKKNAQTLAQQILAENRHIKTIAVKTGKVKGRLRTRKIEVIAGIKTKETIHKENNCLMKLNVETCYFSPRLSNERIEIAKKIKGRKKVLVLFAGIAPYALVISRQNPKAEITAVELNRTACKYAEENVKLNKFSNIKIVQGDVKKVIRKSKSKFDFIVMPRPQLKENFLEEAFAASKKGTIIFYYDFAKQDEVSKKVKEVENEAKKAKKKIKILNIRKAGEIAPYKFRIRVDFKVV